MANMKYAFAAVAILVISFVGLMLFSGVGKPRIADMPIDESIPVNSGGQLPSGGTASGTVQEVSLRALGTGVYDKSSISVKAGQPVRLSFSAEPSSGCGRQLIIDRVGVNVVSRNGETVAATFTPPSPGNYNYHCGMNMFRGVLVAS